MLSGSNHLRVQQQSTSTAPAKHLEDTDLSTQPETQHSSAQYKALVRHLPQPKKKLEEGGQGVNTATRS